MARESEGLRAYAEAAEEAPRAAYVDNEKEIDKTRSKTVKGS